MTRTYAVTGAASGIGKLTTDLLRDDGHKVITVDLKEADVQVDLTTEQGRTDLVSQVTELSDGTLNGVIACAGLSAPIVATAAVNYFGAVATLHGLRPLLAKGEQPRATVISSLAALEPLDDELFAAMQSNDEATALQRAEEIAEGAASGASNTIYNSSKNAIARWVKKHAVTEEWAGAGIAINAIAPGVFETPMMSGFSAEVRESLEATVPFPRRLGRPSEFAQLVEHILSNSYINGTVIRLDGGVRML